MATRRRDLTPRKDKTRGQSPSHKTNKATSAKTNSPQTHDPTTPKKHGASSLRLAAVRSSGANDVHKQLVKTPTSSDSTARRKVDKTSLPAAQKTRVLTKPPLFQSRDTTQSTTQKRQVSTNPSLRSRDNTPSPAQKKQVSTSPSLRSRDKTPLRQKRHVVTSNPSLQPREKTQLPAQRTNVLTNSSLRPRDQTPLRARKKQVSPSPFPGKTIASEKTGPGKILKALNKDDGRRTLQETPTSTTLKTCSSGEETKYSTTFHENVENLNVYQNIPEAETLLEDQEPFAFPIQQEVRIIEEVELEEHYIKVASGDGKGIICLAPEEEDSVKPLYIAEIEAENHDDDDKGTEVVTIASSPVFGQEVFVDSKTQESEGTSFVEEKLEEPTVQEIIDNREEEAGENKVEKEKASENKGDEFAGECGELVVEKQKQKWENEGQTQGGSSRWKKSCVVSNNAIEETATKLRDQRTSRVRALAGAFESVMQ